MHIQTLLWMGLWDQSNPSILNHDCQSVSESQGHVSRSASRLPVHPSAGNKVTKDETQMSEALKQVDQNVNRFDVTHPVKFGDF